MLPACFAAIYHTYAPDFLCDKHSVTWVSCPEMGASVCMLFDLCPVPHPQVEVATKTSVLPCQSVSFPREFLGTLYPPPLAITALFLY